MHAVAVYGTLTARQRRLYSRFLTFMSVTAPNIKFLPYSRRALMTLFAPFSASRAMLLHSGFAEHSHNRFDILVAQPRTTLTTRGAGTEIESDGVTTYSMEDPFSLLQQQLAAQNWQPVFNPDLPFQGGATGLFGYDLGRRVETLPQLAEADLALPDMAVGIYDWALIADHQLQTLTLLSYGDVEQRWRWLNSQTAPTERPFTLLSDWRANMSRQQYGEKFQRIQHYLRSGDCYQINLAQRFSADYRGMNGRRFAD